MTTKNSERQTLVLSTPYKEVAELVRTLVCNKFVFKRPRQLRMEIFDVNGDGKHWWVLAFGFSVPIPSGQDTLLKECQQLITN